MRRGKAAGVEYVALPPADGRDKAPIVLVWHMMDPPSTPEAMAAALPLADVPAWRVYPWLPLHGVRAPAGGADEVARLTMEDAVLNLYGPVFRQASAEVPELVAALREQLDADPGPIGLVGGSAGGAIVLATLTEIPIEVSAAVAVNPVSRLADLIAANEKVFQVVYGWTAESELVAHRYDFPARADEMAARGPVPLLLIGGAEDHVCIREPLAELGDHLRARSADPTKVGQLTVPGMSHLLADPPGTEPAPQTPYARVVDRETTAWLQKYL